MNERIEKLIEQCTVQEFSDCTGGFETFDKEKFAQSIVMECTKILADNGEFRSCVIIGKHFRVFGVEK